jgi:hypothetical protein
MRGMSAPFLIWGWGSGVIRWIIPCQVGIQRAPDNLCYWQVFLLASLFQLSFLSLRDVDIRAFFAHGKLL